MTLEFADKAKTVKIDTCKNQEVVESNSNVIAKLRLELEGVQLENKMLNKKNEEQSVQLNDLQLKLDQQQKVSMCHSHICLHIVLQFQIQLIIVFSFDISYRSMIPRNSLCRWKINVFKIPR